MKELDDYKLIEMYLAGNNRAFEILYGRYRDRLFYFICRMLNYSRNEAEDIFQQVWIKAIDKMSALKADGSFYCYLQRIARNLIIDRARKFKRHGVHVTIDDENSVPVADRNAVEPYFELFEKEDEKLLAAAVAGLNPEQKRIWELRMQNYSFKEIAEMEKCSLNTALARMSYAKKNIKIYLGTHH